MSRFPMMKTALLVIIFLGLIGATAGSTIFFYQKYNQAQKEIELLKTEQGQAKIIEEETATLIAAVSKLILLPENESPVVATIVNSAKLAETQPFYKGSQDGDKLLIFPESEKALIYSPARNILVSVGPAFVEKETSNSDQSTPSPTPSATPKSTPDEKSADEE